PDSQTVLPGNNTSYTVTVLPTDDFTNSVTLSVSGLPSGASGAFVPPSVTGSNVSTLNISTISSTPNGTYALTITGAGGGVTNTDIVTLIVSSNAPVNPGTLIWTSGSGSGINWSTALNWTNLSIATNGPPGPQNDVVFTNNAAVPAFGSVNNTVDTSATINSLWYGISPAGLP